MALIMRFNGPTVVKHGSSRGAVRCAAVPMGHLDHAASVYTHTSTATSMELVKYVGNHGRFPKPFVNLPPPELFQLADASDTKIPDARDEILKKVIALEEKAAEQMKNQNVTPEQKFAAVERRS